MSYCLLIFTLEIEIVEEGLNSLAKVSKQMKKYANKNG